MRKPHLRCRLPSTLCSSAGMKQQFEGVEYTIAELTKDRYVHSAPLCVSREFLRRLTHPLTTCSFKGVDIALFSAGGDVSRDFAPAASAAGATVVDNSSAFRMSDGVPLVVPEVNPEAMKGMKAGKGGIIANPNCSTIIALMAVTPLHRVSPIQRMVVSTYQAASGAGAAAMAELELQTRESLAGQPITKKIFKQQVRLSRHLRARLCIALDGRG